MSGKKPKIITFVTIFLALFLSYAWAIIPPSVTEAEEAATDKTEDLEEKLTVGKSVLVNLETNQLFLYDGTTTVAVIQIVSQGRPGSYYETIGGTYTSDYKVPLHFSSFGYVYMPYSVHLFGNYFIHGIPYYPNGEKVSSSYSGGCIRLLDDDAKKVYNFISTTTPITITKGNYTEFTPTKVSEEKISSMSMTRLMTALISLELLKQDDEITDTDGITITTRKELLYRLLKQDDDAVSVLYAGALGEKSYVAHMNKRAATLGLTNTVFTSVRTPAVTTEEEYGRFMNYIMTYKSFLVTDIKK